jgi:hypothetical protein
MPYGEPQPWRIALVWWEGSISVVSFPDLDALAKGGRTIEAWRGPRDKPRFVIEQIAPDGVYKIRQPWAGGTWGGRCGSTAWIEGPARNVEQPRYISDSWALCSQAWWRNGIGANRGWTGYRVECERPRHSHAELCTGAGYRWSWRDRATRPIEDLLGQPDLLAACIAEMEGAPQ